MSGRHSAETAARWSVGRLVRVLLLLPAVPDRWLGKLGRRALDRPRASGSLSTLDTVEFGRLLRRDPQTKAVLLGGDVDRYTCRQLLQVADREELRAASAGAILRHSDAVGRAQVIYDVVGLSGPDISIDQRAAALIVCGRVGASLLESQASAILVRCLTLAAQPIDPYERPDLPVLARRAATAILEEHPELDQVLRDRITATGMAHPSDLVILAAALVRRPHGRSDAICEMFTAWRPTAGEALRFAADADLTRAPNETSSMRLTVQSHRLRKRARIGTPFAWGVAVPAFIGVSVWATYHRRWTSPPLQVGFGEALGALALVAAIHVVSAQLAASRLEGVLARYTTNSLSLSFSYWAAATMAACSITGQKPRFEAALGWSGTFSAAVFIVSAIFAAWTLVRQTDPGRAAGLFAQHRRRFYQRSGRRLGRLQRHAMAFRDSAQRVALLALTTEPLHVERRLPIIAGHRGMLLPRLRSVEHLRQRPPWAQGHLRLQVLARVGTIVAEGTEVAAVLPDVDSPLVRAEGRKAKRAVSLRSVRTIEEAAEGVVLLTAVAARLARAGDRGGAERTAEALRSLLTIHLAGAYSRRHPIRGPAELAPATPALRDALGSIVVHLSEADTELAVELLGGLLEEVVFLGHRSDSAVAIVATKIGALDDRISRLSLAGILRAMSRRCLESGDRNALRLVQREIEKRLFADGHPVWEFVEVASELPALAAWIDQPTAMGCWRWYWEATQAPPPARLRLLLAARIGAANLAGGSISVAVAVALSLRDAGVNLSDLTDGVTAEDHLAREKVWSQMGGGYLGASPGDALVTFMDFARRSATAIRP